jgi:hypothetical protein
MTDDTQLFETRIHELTRLIDDHLERGSLDEGNATAFDHIIDAWLKEELARLDGAVTDWANREASARAASEAEAQRRRTRERSSDERWQKITESHHAALATAAEARHARLVARVRTASDRLDQARTDFATARSLLLGVPASSTTPLAAPDEPDADRAEEGVA